MFLTIAIFCGLILWPIPANSALVIIEIEAVVDDVQDPDNYLDGGINIGDLITGTYTYDTDTPDSSPSPNVGRYEYYGYPCGFFLTVGGFEFVTDPADSYFFLEIGNDIYVDDYLVRSDRNLPLSNGTSVNNITWSLQDLSATALTSTELPTIAPVLEDWQVNHLSIGGGPGDRVGFSLSGHVTSAVVIPEPTTVVLLGLGGVIFVQRGKK